VREKKLKRFITFSRQQNYGVFLLVNLIKGQRGPLLIRH